MDKPKYNSVYYAIDSPENAYEDYKIRQMMWLDTPQNYRDLESGNIYNTYGDAFDEISDY